MEEEDLVERTPLSPERITELLQLCLKSTYFSYNGEFYEQRQGAAMGSPVSAVVANLYMEFFEPYSQLLDCGSGMWMTHAA